MDEFETPMVNMYCSPYGDYIIPQEIFDRIRWKKAKRRHGTAYLQVKKYPANLEFWHWLIEQDLQTLRGDE